MKYRPSNTLERYVFKQNHGMFVDVRLCSDLTKRYYKFVITRNNGKEEIKHKQRIKYESFRIWYDVRDKYGLEKVVNFKPDYNNNLVNEYFILNPEEVL